MAYRKCKRPFCPKHLPAGGNALDVHQYGYCSWGCLEADNPALAERIRKKNAASRKAAAAVLLAVCFAIFFGIRWFLRLRTENPARFERLAARGGIVLAVIVVLGTWIGNAGARGVADSDVSAVCDAIRGAYNQRIFDAEACGIPSKRWKSPESLKTLAEAGMKCPGGGTYSVENGTLVCSKHKNRQ